MRESAPVTSEELRKKLAEFINTWPLYSPFQVTALLEPGESEPSLPNTILRECPNCEATPTWKQEHPSKASLDPSPEYLGTGSVLAYRCTHCSKAQLRVWYLLSSIKTRKPDGSQGLIARITLRKLGQYPA
jgi:hypothetical protein